MMCQYCSRLTFGTVCAACKGDTTAMQNELAAQQPPTQGGLGLTGGGQPGIADMERAAYERGVREERERIVAMYDAVDHSHGAESVCRDVTAIFDELRCGKDGP